eukprot:11195266-Lingulodinium_polyedra.AAC.1
MDAARGALGGMRGCSMIAKPPLNDTSVAVAQANRVRRLAVATCMLCLTDKCETSQGNWADLKGGGPNLALGQ